MALAVRTKYEFFGPPGATAIVFGLPVLLWTLFFGCNDVSGCPAPALLSPRDLTWAKLKSEIPWPENGVRGFVSWEVTFWTFAYYFLSLVLHRVMPAQEVVGTKLRDSGRPLTYRFNAFNASVVQLIACAFGTYLQGADFVVWKFMTDNYLQLLTTNILLAYAISIWVYAKSFSVKPGNPELRELAQGGHTGNVIYDFYIGRELNPRVTWPFFGEIDVKTFLEMRPGLTGWILLNCANIAKQYRNYGFVSDSILFTTAVQAYYVLEGQYMETGILTMMDITTDGLGFMLTFGDIAWLPFLYSTQTRYLSTYPVTLGPAGLAIVSAVFATGLYIFRSSNSQKNLFRRDPNHPSVKNLSYIQTKRGTRLLTAGWWGMSRHINYFGDWLQASPFSLPTGIAGYMILPAGSAVAEAGATMVDGRQVIQGAARGWGMLFTYLYVVYFAVLLIHREGRDDVACSEKYGEDWEKYKKAVKYKILPFMPLRQNHAQDPRPSPIGQPMLLYQLPKVTRKVEYNDPESMMRTYSDKATDSGNTVGRAFCANCGSPVRGDSSKFPGFLIVPVGCLDGSDADKADLRPTAEYFCLSKAAWLPGLEGTEKVDLGPAMNYS
ncbi:Delta(14)-sterol reductase [Pyricularia oryzae Y34]|uniref:Delta(14)-sterol reductase n=2 Tax=Pyricularia oryzae TaxID=318829 RepID=A0AA97PG08_PYRO3|nr:Delta(14)-sterol reductase [Pyricularia oryzae Y34]